MNPRICVGDEILYPTSGDQHLKEDENNPCHRGSYYQKGVADHNWGGVFNNMGTKTHSQVFLNRVRTTVINDDLGGSLRGCHRHQLV